MSTDEFRGVARVVSRWWLARTLGSGVAAVGLAARRSLWAPAFARVSHQIGGASLAARVRLAGVFLLSATLTHRLLLELVPVFARPAAAPLLRVEAVLASLVLLIAAPWLARAWPGCRLRRTLLAWMR